MVSNYRKINIAAGWSSLAEICARLIAPLSALLLARVLTPADFGVMAVVTLLISFADMMSECGFQKFLVQQHFRKASELREYADTVLLTSLTIASIEWLLIALFSDKLAQLGGAPAAGNMIALAGMALPLSAVSGTQSALLKRWMHFKALFRIRVAAAVVPLVVTLPLAIMQRNWTALLFGLLATNFLNVVLAAKFTHFRPCFHFSKKALVKMAPFSCWSIVESMLIWLTTYLDVLIVGIALDSRHLGLYRTATMTVAQIIGIITAAVTPVLFSALAREKYSSDRFRDLFFNLQRKTALLLVPICADIFIFSDLVTELLLGNQWLEISGFIGLWALTAIPVTLVSHFSAEVYRASGKPVRGMLSQLLHLIVVIPVVVIALDFGFDTLCTARAIVRLEAVIVNLVFLQLFYNCRTLDIFSNIIPAVIAGCAMMVVMWLPQPSTVGETIAQIMISLALYIGVLSLHPSQRKELREFVSSFLLKRFKRVAQ